MDTANAHKTDKAAPDKGVAPRARGDQSSEPADDEVATIPGLGLIELLRDADPEQRERNMLWLQRTVGNTVVCRATVARDPDPSGGSGNFEGVPLSTSAASMRKALEAYVVTNGLKALLGWQGRWAVLTAADKVAHVHGQDDVTAVDSAVTTAAGALRSEGTAFENSLQQKAVDITRKVLSQSKKTIEAELEHYGVEEKEYRPAHMEGTQGGMQAYPTRVEMSRHDLAADAKSTARALSHARTEADNARTAFQSVMQSLPGYQSIKDELPAELRNAEYDAAENLWQMLEDIYTKRALASTAEFPILAMYAGQDNPAAALLGFANTPDADTAQLIWDESQKRLANIEAVDKGLGSSFEPLLEDRIVAMVLAGEGVTPWLRKVGRDKVEQVKEGKAAEKMFLTVVAIGLGALAALPSGGSSMVAGVAAAAAATGAGLAVYNAYKAWKEYEVKSAATKTAYAKADAISKDEPSFFWLALEVVGALAEVGAAAAAFKALVKIVKDARAAKDVLKMAEAVDAVAPAGCRTSVKAKVAGEMGDEAVGKLIKAEGDKFRDADLAKIRESLEAVKDEAWTRAYDAMVDSGNVRPLTPRSIRDNLGGLDSPDPRYSNLAEYYLGEYRIGTWEGVYIEEIDMVFVRPGSQHQMATVVAHEFVHAGQKRFDEKLAGFWIEFEAHAAQKRVILALDRHGIKVDLDEKVAWLREADDMALATRINSDYGWPIPPEFTAGSAVDAQIARAAITAAKKVWAVGNK